MSGYDGAIYKTCRESAETISPLYFRARSIARALFPDAVVPAMTTIRGRPFPCNASSAPFAIIYLMRVSREIALMILQDDPCVIQ